MEVTLIDSPVANVANIARALRHVGAELRLTRDASEVAAARKVVLPGVGSFVAAMAWLRDTRIDAALREAVLERGAALLGICVGHQLLFGLSTEMGTTRGLGLVQGEVTKYEDGLPVPQIGWNAVAFGEQPSILFTGVRAGTPFYFVNSYAAAESPAAAAFADYGGAFVAAVDAAAGRGRVYGLQFHPEKSSTAGLRVLRNYVEQAA